MTQAALVVMIYQSTQMTTTWVVIMKFVTPQRGNKQTNKPSLQRKSSALLKEPRMEGGREGQVGQTLAGSKRRNFLISAMQCIRGEFWCWDVWLNESCARDLFFIDDTSGIPEEVLDVTKRVRSQGLCKSLIIRYRCLYSLNIDADRPPLVWPSWWIIDHLWTALMSLRWDKECLWTRVLSRSV